MTFYFCIIHKHSMYSCLYLHYITTNWINSKLRIISTWYDIEARVWVVFGTHLLAKYCQCKQYMFYHTQTTRSNSQVKMLNYQVIWPGRTWCGVATAAVTVSAASGGTIRPSWSGSLTSSTGLYSYFEMYNRSRCFVNFSVRWSSVITAGCLLWATSM